MKLTMKAGIATAALSIAACFTAPAAAGDLRDIFSRGSDDGDHKTYTSHYRSGGHHAGPCYFRADVGYSWSRDPEVKWPVTSDVEDLTDPYNPVHTSTLIGDSVSGVSLDNTWFGEAGAGCGSGSRGLRAEVMFGVHSQRDLQGEPLPFTNSVIDPINGDSSTGVDDDPMHTTLRSYTMMLNVYKDFGNRGGLTPYVGAGVGLAYNKLTEVYFTGNPNLLNRIRGNSDLSLAWSLMAGVGYQVSERAILDIGYRFIDMGSISSDRADTAGFVNPAIDIDDIRAHEIKVGIRYHFGEHDDDDDDNGSYK